MESVNEKRAHDSGCGIPGACSREIPLWMIAIDNVPTLVMFFFGAALLWHLWKPLSLVYLIYCGLSVILFWGLICSCCHHYGSRACPCGYGVIAPKIFKTRKNKDFRKVFKHNIGIMFPCWLVPAAAGIYLLHYNFSRLLLGIFLGFCIVGFAVIPVIAKFVGCKGCEIKDDCPWMSSGSRRGWAGRAATPGRGKPG